LRITEGTEKRKNINAEITENTEDAKYTDDADYTERDSIKKLESAYQYYFFEGNSIYAML